MTSTRRRGAVFIALLLIIATAVAALFAYRYLAGTPRRSHGTPPVKAAAPGPDDRSTVSPGSDDATEDGVAPAVHQQAPVMHGAPQPPPGRRMPVQGAKGELAIIIDDMGDSVELARELAALDANITFAIIPGKSRDREVAEMAAEGGVAPMLHIPMEPLGWPKTRLESNGLLMSMESDAVRERVEQMLERLPQVAGANNHMGSRLTGSTPHMMAVMAALAGKGLFFIDSRTASTSVALDVARAAGVGAAGRDVFLDNTQTVDAVSSQLRKAASLAEKRGSVIAIGHPHRETVEALRLVIPELKKAGISFVPASRFTGKRG